MRILLLGLLMLLSIAAYAADGMVVMVSEFPVTDTTDRLEQAVKKAGFTVMARIDHAAGAKKVGLELAPTELLIFGKPKAGTLLIQASPTVGIDLPLKYLVWQDANGVVQIAWNGPEWIKQRHQITGQDKLLGKMAGGLKKIAGTAAKK